MKDIKNREDVFLLVDTFYKVVREDVLLGLIFNQLIQDWESHLEKITDFWETNLFVTIHKYRGNPLDVHVQVDEEVDNQITQQHFSRWLLLWVNTIDRLFVGENAQTAKMRARKMGTYLFMKIKQSEKWYL